MTPTFLIAAIVGAILGPALGLTGSLEVPFNLIPGAILGAGLLWLALVLIRAIGVSRRP